MKFIKYFQPVLKIIRICVVIYEVEEKYQNKAKFKKFTEEKQLQIVILMFQLLQEICRRRQNDILQAAKHL